MSTGNGNGVIRINRKGIKKFAFGDGEPFDVDIVIVQQQWLVIDESFRPPEINDDGTTNENRAVPNDQSAAYYEAARDFVSKLASVNNKGEITRVTIAEALEFLARLREQWSDLVSFFRPRSRDERESPDTSTSPSVEILYSEEPGTN